MTLIQKKMKNWALPPKRFEIATLPRFDEVRCRAWFPRLLKRKWQIPHLHSAACSMEPGVTQKAAAAAFGVDERELRDYVPWSMGIGNRLTAPQQAAFNSAYHYYCLGNAAKHFKSYLEEFALLVPMKPRALMEIWEVNPIAWPSGYLQLKL